MNEQNTPMTILARAQIVNVILLFYALYIIHI